MDAMFSKLLDFERAPKVTGEGREGDTGRNSLLIAKAQAIGIN